MRPPCLVDVDGNVSGMGSRDDAAQIGRHAAIRWADESDQLGVGMRLQRGLHLTGADAEPDTQLGMQERGDVDGDGAGQDQGDKERFVQVARNDDLVAGTYGCQQERMVPRRRAVEQEEAAFSAPGVGGEHLRHPQRLAAKVRIVDTAAEGNIARERALAEGLAQLHIGAAAKLVAGCREGTMPWRRYA